MHTETPCTGWNRAKVIHEDGEFQFHGTYLLYLAFVCTHKEWFNIHEKMDLARTCKVRRGQTAELEKFGSSVVFASLACARLSSFAVIKYVSR